MDIGIVQLTEGNINNNHIYLSGVWDLFPERVIGGPSKAEPAAATLELNIGFGEPIVTDIAGDKKIFRQRRWVSGFFERNNLKAGDKVVIKKTADLQYHIYPER